MATAQVDRKRSTTSGELRDPKGGSRAPKEALRSLASTIEWLRAEGLLMETETPVSGDLELTGIQKHFDGSYPILFNNVKGYPHVRAITNFFANMDVVDRLFGWADRTARTRELAEALTHPIKSEIVAAADAPVMQEVITDDLD